MSNIALTSLPDPIVVGRSATTQLCYALLSIDHLTAHHSHPVNWALVADASRSMRIPIVDEDQFRQLAQRGSVQETLVDGVPVWQLSGPVPPDIRDASRSALDYVAHALHTVVEHLNEQDRFILIACAEDATVLVPSTSGSNRVRLVEGISDLKSIKLGNQTDLAQGLQLALQEIRYGRNDRRVEYVLLLTDGFTEHTENCLQLARDAAAEGIAISTIGLGSEFHEHLLTILADHSNGRSVFLNSLRDIPRSVAEELNLVRSVAARSLSLSIFPAHGITVHRVTRIYPTLTQLIDCSASSEDIAIGNLLQDEPMKLLVEFLIDPDTSEQQAALAHIRLDSERLTLAEMVIKVQYQSTAPVLSDTVLDAASRATAYRMQLHAQEALDRGNTQEAIRLLQIAATRLNQLQETTLANILYNKAHALSAGEMVPQIATKVLTYRTRRLNANTEH
ncbi:MAG: VWA domain-containing protein [Chloroflexota bacterium]